MPYLKTYDIFISHAWKYGDEYERLVGLLDKSSLFKFRNYSAPDYKPLHNIDATDVRTETQIKEAIDRKIRNVNCVLVISGMYLNNRKWMLYEIDSALRHKKPIIAIIPYHHKSMPSFIQNIANEIVYWNTDSIVSAIRKHSI